MALELQPVQTNFTTGEVSPRMRARRDVKKFNNAVEKMLNFILFPLGGVERRQGTHFVAETKASATLTTLIKFEFSVTDVYALAFGEKSVRFFRNRGQLVTDNGGGGITDFANGAFASNLTSWTVSGATHNTADSGYCDLPSTKYIEQALVVTSGSHNDDTIIKFRVRTGLVRLTIGLTSGATDIKVATDYKKGYHCVSFKRTAAGSAFFRFMGQGGAAAIDDISAKNDGQEVEIDSPYANTDVADIKWAQSADQLYLAHHTYPPYRLDRLGNLDWSLIEVTEDFTANPFDAVGKYPRAVAFYEERLFWGGTDNDPQTFWASISGNFLNYTIGTDATDALSFTISSDDVNIILFMSPGTVLFVGTNGGEFIIRSSSQEDPITPTNISVKRETNNGCNSTPPSRVDNTLLFIQRLGKKLREFTFRFEIDSFVAPDLSILSEHLTREVTIDRTTRQKNPGSVVWAITSDGKLIGLTYEREEEVIGWHQHIIGGVFGAGSAIVESVVAMPSGAQDEIWIVVKRTINSATKRYVEYFTNEFAIDDTAVTDSDTCHFVDSGLRYNGTATKTLSGLGHLEGETVQILGDGAVFTDKVVSSGVVTTSENVTRAVVGLKYTSELISFPPDLEFQEGSTQGRAKVIHRVLVYLHNTLGLQYGIKGKTRLDTVPFRKATDLMDAPPSIFTGTKLISPQGNWQTETQTRFVQEQPLPCTILGLVHWINVGKM